MSGAISRMWCWLSGFKIRLIVLLGVAMTAYWYWPESPSRRFQAAWSAVLRNDLATVRNELDYFRRSPLQQPERRVLEAALLLRAKRYDDALNLLSKTKPEGETRWALLQIVGESLYWKHQTADSERLFHILVKERPEDAAPHSWLGAIYYDLGHIAAARLELQRAIELNPNDARPHRLLSQIESSSDNYPLAIHHYREILRLSPGEQNRQFAEELGDLLIKVQDFVAAKDVVQQIKPPTATSLALLGECEWSLGRKKQATGLVTDALRLDPTHIRAGLLKADWAVEAKEPADAIQQLKRILQVSPYESPGWYQLARAQQMLGAREQSEDAMKSFEASQALHQQFGELQSKVRANPEDIVAREQMVELALKLGKPEVAEFWRRAAIAWRNRGSNSSEQTPQTKHE